MVKDDNHRTRGLYYQEHEIPISHTSEGFKLITRIQDEVHRFAIEYPRLLRSKGQIHSILDDIEGIGPTRRKALMKYLKFFISFQTLIVVLTLFSKLVQFVGYIFFFLVCLPFFFNMNFTNATLINEALRIVFQMSIIVCGSLVFCEIVLRKFSSQIERVGQILNINKYSVMGIILSFGTSIAMLPLFSKMNKKGKILNAAFSLSGAFVFGGQLGFIASVNPASVTWFVVVKLLAGILGLVIANVLEE